MGSRRPRSVYVLLTRHFLRQFLENDLLSPDADRSQLLAIVGASAISLTLFISVFLSFNYVGAFLTPGQAAVLSLDDKFFYIALSMLATALVAASQWDSLAVDARDAAILEPLPLHVGVIRRAKLSAVAILGGAVALALNVVPAVVFPWLLVFSFRQMTVLAMAGLMVAHLAVTVAAAAFGYLTVLALREMLAGVLGARWSARVAPWVQGVLIVALGSALLLMPPVAGRIANDGFADWRALTPPMWFLGVHESAVGGTIADLPRGRMNARQAQADVRTSALYRTRRGEFPRLAGQAAGAFGALAAVWAVAYLWNSRRLPSLAPVPSSSRRRRWRAVLAIANAVIVRNPTARAGFYFTLAAMWRSNTHRLTLACAAAAGLAMAVIAVSGAPVQRGGAVSARLLAAQPLLCGALLFGFRHIIRVPAELRANWGVQLAWRNLDRPFVNGVKRAAVVALVVPALTVTLPLFVFVLGPETAMVHAAMELAGAIVFLEALMVTYDKVPFTCTYLPNDTLKALAPLYGILFVAGAASFAAMQQRALTGGGVVRPFIVLAVLFAILRVTSNRRPRLSHIEFDEAPATFQRLGLHT